MPGAGVDTDAWDCPCDVDDLAEWVVKEDWECDVCGEEFPEGTLFHGNRDEEWDVCEYCYNGKEKGAAPTEEAVSQAEMEERMKQLDVLDNERQAENKVTTEASLAAGIVSEATAQAQSGAGFAAGATFTFAPGMRVQAYLRVLGRRSEEPSFGTMLKQNPDKTVDILFDMGKTQTSLDPMWASPITAEFEAMAYERRIQAEQRKMIEKAKKDQAKKFEAKKVSGVYAKDDAVLYLHVESKMGWQPGFIMGLNEGDGTYNVQGKKSNGRTDWFKHWPVEKLKHYDGPVERTVCRTSHGVGVYSTQNRFRQTYGGKMNAKGR